MRSAAVAENADAARRPANVMVLSLSMRRSLALKAWASP
jgi:hypothetical protein